MRKIKFRAWIDKKDTWRNQGMYGPFGFEDIYCGYDERRIYCSSGDLCQPDWDSLILMQYTGLKDKNGKEIYEGDIVKYQTSYEREDDYRDETTTIEWHKECAGFHPFIMNNRWRCDVVNVEIIGNIYENPKLLTDGVEDEV